MLPPFGNREAERAQRNKINKHFATISSEVKSATVHEIQACVFRRTQTTINFTIYFYHLFRLPSSVSGFFSDGLTSTNECAKQAVRHLGSFHLMLFVQCHYENTPMQSTEFFLSCKK